MYAWQRNALAKLEMSVGVHRPQVETAKRLLAKAWVPHFPEPNYAMGQEGSGEFRWSVDDRVLTLVLFKDGRYRVERTLPAEMTYSAAPDFHHDLMWLLFGDESAFEHPPLRDKPADDANPDPLRVLPTEVKITTCHVPPTIPGAPLRRAPKTPIDVSGLGDSRKGPLVEAIERASAPNDVARFQTELSAVRDWAASATE